MNYKIKEKCRIALATAVLSLTGILLIAAQTPEPQLSATPSKTAQLYVVSAQAGGVSYITGTAHVERAGVANVLAIGDELAATEKVSVESDGKIEVLLNPGSYLRVGGNSKFEFTNTALDALGVDLARGSALIEATTVSGEQGANISISTPQTKVQLEKSGLYRLNVTSEITEIFVWNGEAKVGSDIVKKGRKLVIGKTGTAAIAKIDKDQTLPDSLDLWSKTRAEELAKLNRELERADLERSFASFNNYDYQSSTGYWCYNRSTHRWCYVPSAGTRCCRAYNHPHSTQVAVNRPDNTSSAPVIVVTKESRSSSPKYDSAETSQTSTRENSSASKAETRANSSPPKSETRDNSSSSKSETRGNSSPSKSDETRQNPSPSKNDSSPAKSNDESSTRDDSPPKKKD